jgi:hypothetical protein
VLRDLRHIFGVLMSVDGVPDCPSTAGTVRNVGGSTVDRGTLDIESRREWCK